MKNWKSIFVVAIVLSLAAGASAQQYVGVFFDEAATNSNATLPGDPAITHTAYVCAVNVDMAVGGAAFVLTIDPQITLIGVTWPGGVQIGTVTTGVEAGYTEPMYAFLGTPAILCTLTLYTGANTFSDAELTVSAHPSYGAVMIADVSGPMAEFEGFTSLLSVPVANEDTSWSDVKNLYR